jgi:CRP-like cAMP-binding protein
VPRNNEAVSRDSDVPADALDADVLQALRRSTLFKGWPPCAVADLASRFRRLEVPAGVVCAREGEPGHEMYVIDDGRFIVETTFGGRPCQLAELGPGAVFGELALLTDQPRSATVTAATNAQIYALGRADFEALTPQHRDLLADLRQIASERLRNPIGDVVANEKTTLTSLGGERSAVAIGRAKDNDLVLDNPRVSRHHALIEARNGSYRIVDLNSTNGSFVNGQRVKSQALIDGDEIVIGSKRIFFDKQALI